MTPAAPSALPTVRSPLRTAPTVATLTVVTVPRAVPPPRRRRAARAALVAFVGAAVLLHAAGVLLVDVARPRLRDPEYGLRAEQLRARVAEHPGRPLVLVVGSSRAAMGVKPDSWEAARPGMTRARPALVQHASVAGAGPITELLVLNRIYADGFRPAVGAAGVLAAHVPPGRQLQRSRPHRRAPAALGRPGRRSRLLPRPRGHRAPDANRPAGRVPHRSRPPLNPGGCPTGRLRGADGRVVDRPRPVGAGCRGWPRRTTRPGTLIDHQRPGVAANRPLGFEIHPDSDRGAVRRGRGDAARAAGVAVGFLYMPESTEFRTWYPPGAEGPAAPHSRRAWPTIFGLR